MSKPRKKEPIDPTFGRHIREQRESRVARGDKTYTLRQVASRLGVEPSYLSKVETADVSPSDEIIEGLAREYGEDPLVFRLIAGKADKDFREEARKRPRVFAEFLRQVRDIPDDAILRIVREVRDGRW